MSGLLMKGSGSSTSGKAKNCRGDAIPFKRLASSVSERDFLAAATDTPFSVPSDFLPQDGYKELLDMVSTLFPGIRLLDAQTFRARSLLAGN